MKIFHLILLTFLLNLQVLGLLFPKSNISKSNFLVASDDEFDDEEGNEEEQENEEIEENA